MPDDVTDDGEVFPADLRRTALESFRQRLVADRNPLATNPDAAAQVLRQADAVLDEAESVCRGRPLSGRTDRLSAEIGVSRADHGVHPMVSVRAATAMFEVLFPITVDRLRALGADETRQALAATTLHRAIMHRFGLGAVAYASFLRQKVNVSHREERLRIARELHDRVTHAVGVALQDLELYSVYADRDPPRARTRIDTAGAALREALDTVRQLAQELRESVSDVGGLGKALADYVDTRVPASTRATVSVTDADGLPPEVGEELYIVLREAIRNVVLHAKASTLSVAVVADGPEVRAVVRDDGQGFDVPAALAAQTGVGLSSMRERIELVGGTLAITSERDRGTTLSIVIVRPESRP